MSVQETVSDRTVRIAILGPALFSVLPPDRALCQCEELFTILHNHRRAGKGTFLANLLQQQLVYSLKHEAPIALSIENIPLSKFLCNTSSGSC